MTRVNCFVFLLVAPLLAMSSHADTSTYRTDTRAYNLAHGRVVFEERCLNCHQCGRKGAPVVGDLDDWRDRIDQPLNTLIQHAIDGHGKMPPRGDEEISKQDVAAAVAFVTHRTRSLLSIDDINNLPPPAAGGDVDAANEPPTGSSDQAVVHMFLMLMGKDRWK